jgi:hypothetical protein
MSTIDFKETTTATPEQFLAALTDFGRGHTAFRLGGTFVLHVRLVQRPGWQRLAPPRDHDPFPRR